MTSPQVGDREKGILHSLAIKCIDVDVPDIAKSISEINKKYGVSNWTQTFAKLSMFDLVEYDKLVFLDSDMMIMKNIDHLFQLDAFSAVVAGQAYPGHETWRHLNSGLLVVEPEPGLKERLVATIPSEVSKPLGDQDIIQAYQSNWPNENRLHLKESYNLFIDCIDYYIRHGILQESDIYVIHFEGGQKPWKWFPGEYVLRVIRMALKRHFYEFRLNHFFCGMSHPTHINSGSCR